MNNFQSNINSARRWSPWVWIIAIVLILILWVVTSYNSLVSKNEAVTSQWGQIDVVLQRRFDLIPNLVSTVKGLTAQEQKVFGDISDARAHYAGASTTDKKAVAAGQFEGSLARLLVITENYPQLRSSEAFQNLMASLEGSENRISVERQKYNAMVQVFDTKIKRFPGNMIAGIFGFHAREYFNAPEEAKTVPKVNFQ